MPRVSLTRWWLWAFVVLVASVTALWLRAGPTDGVRDALLLHAASSQQVEQTDRTSPARESITVTGVATAYADARQSPVLLSDGVPGALAAVQLSAPETIRGGTEFTVACRLGGVPDGSQGWVDLTFDPGLLTLADVSTRYDLQEPGLVRVYVSGSGQGTTEVRLQFMPSFAAPALTTLSLTTGNLITSQGRYVGLGNFPSIHVAFVAE